MTAGPFHARPATPGDFREILRWMESDHLRGESAFWQDREQIERDYREGWLSVVVGTRARRAVGFADYPPNEIARFEVRASRRGRGAGTVLAEHLVEAARVRGDFGLALECVPPRSETLWRRLGFRRGFDAGGKAEYWLPFRRHVPLPAEAARRLVTIELLSPAGESLVWDAFEAEAAEVGGRLVFGREFAAHTADGNARVRVSVGATPWGHFKVQYAAEVGGERSSPWVRLRSLPLRPEAL